jgi:hypothetical protein
MGFSRGPSIVKDGLVLYLDAANQKSYPGSGTTWNDLSGNGNNGTLLNGVGFDGANLGSLVFDEVDDYITVNNFNVNNSITVEGWFNVKKSSWAPIIGNWNSTGNGDSWLLTKNSSNIMSFYVRFNASTGDVINDTQTTTNGVWQQYVGVFNNFNLSLYKNGFLVNSKTTTSNTLHQNSLEIWLGRFSSFYFQGNIGNCKVYNRALTPQEILQNYNATKGRYGL